MSLWADAKLREHTAKIQALELEIERLKQLIADMVAPRAFGNGSKPPEPQDKRTREWREWNEQFNHGRT